MTLQKTKRWRSEKYLKWVREQPCAICGVTANDYTTIHAHHIKGVGGLSGAAIKADDSMVMPLCDKHHSQMHSFPDMWSGQWELIAKTLLKAFRENVVDTTK